MEEKKISFGFSKITKKSNLLPTKESAKVELIKCLEGQKIKLVEETPELQPLIIPLKESQKTSAALASLIKRRAVLLDEEEPEAPIELGEKTHINLSSIDIEKRAAEELLAEVQNITFSNSKNSLVVPVVKPDDLPLEGAKESTLDDYETIAIEDFGKAMLRGMGWTEPLVNKNKADNPLEGTPIVRPKGMGLGADKGLSKKTFRVAPEANELLEIKRNAYVRILGGKLKDLYGQIEGFDDHAGRIIVKMAIGGNKEAFNEFLCQPVAKKEYAQYGKCINACKYEKYKKNENEYGQIIRNEDEKNPDGKTPIEANMFKKYQTNSDEDYNYNKNISNYETTPKNEEYKEYYDIKKENRNRRERYKPEICTEKEVDRKYVKHKYEDKYCKSDRDCKRETKRDEDRNRRMERNSDDQQRQYKLQDEKGYKRDNKRDVIRNTERYETKSSRNYIEYKDMRCNKDISNPDNRGRDRQHNSNRDKYKVKDSNNSTDSETESHYSRHKNSKKSKHSKKKTKKSKKSKSKCLSGTDDSLSS